jgi:hypothetical protein
MLLVAPLVSIAVAGCSGFGVEEKRRLDEVRQQIADAEREPAIQTHAASFLAIADKTLQEARSADDPTEARHLIYLAQRRLEIARSVAGLKLAAARLENLPEKSGAPAGVPGRFRSQEQSAGAMTGGPTSRSNGETDGQMAARPDPGKADFTVAAPVPPKKPQTERGADPDRQASLLGTERQGTGGAKERLWKVLPMESLFADAELSRLAPTVGQDLAPLVRFLRENEGSIVLIKGNLVKKKPTEKELTWSVHAAEAIKAHLVEADIASNRIFTIGRIESRSARAGSEPAKKNFPVGRIEIALFDGSFPSTSSTYAPLR